MRTSTIIGLGVGVLALGAGWLIWGRQAWQVSKGTEASKRALIKTMAPNSTASKTRIALIRTPDYSIGAQVRRGATIETGFQGAYDAGMALRGAA
jgi:hypothetical protein